MFCFTPQAVGLSQDEVPVTSGPVLVGKVARTDSLAVLRGHKHVGGGRGGGGGGREGE